MRFFIALLLCTTVHAAGPVRVAFDTQVVAWNNRCITNNPFATASGAAPIGTALNPTHSLLASTVWMGAVRAAGLYPGNIVRANLICGGSYGGTTGAGGCVSVGCYNIGSPQIPLINDVGTGMDVCLNTGIIDARQGYWRYQEVGAGGGLSVVDTNHYVGFNTGIVPSTDVSAWQNDAHLCAYFTVGNVAPDAYFIGAQDVAGNNAFNFSTGVVAVNGQLAAIWSVPDRATTSDTNGTGFYLGTRNSSATNGLTIYRNSTLAATSATSGGNPASLATNIYVFCCNQNGTAILPANVRSAGYAFGHGITGVTAYYNAWQQFETLLGRQK